VTGGSGAGAVIFKSVGGVQLPIEQVPKYLGLNSAHKGVAPLFDGDPRWRTWWDGNPPERAEWERVNGTKKTPPPITRDDSGNATGINCRVLADPGPDNGGWILHACWPT
jgi:hypothetical protein